MDKITYDDHIKDIFRTSCSSCHKPSKQKGGLNLMTYSDAIKGSSSGLVLEPGNLDSVLVECISWLDEDTRMPPKEGKLTDKEISLIKKWISGGLPENKASRKIISKSSVEAFKLPTLQKGEISLPMGLSIEPTIRYEHAMPIQAIASSPSSPLIAVSAYKQILLFSSKDLDILGVLDFPEGQIYDLKFSRDGALLLGAGGMNGDRGSVVIWNIKSGERIKEINEDFDTIMAADMSADGKYIATGSSDKLIRIYELASGELLESFKKHSAWISAIRFSPQGQLLATGDQNGQVVIWDLNEMDMMYNLYKHKGQINSLTWRPDSKLLASASQDNSAIVWNVESGESSKSLKGHGNLATLDLQYNSKGELLSTGGDNVVRVWDASYKTAFYHKTKLGAMNKAIPVLGGKHYVSSMIDGHFYLWDKKSKKMLKSESTLLPLLDERIHLSNQELSKVISLKDEIEASLSDTEKKLSEIKAAPQNLIKQESELQRLLKLKDLLRSNNAGAADSQLSSSLRESQRNRRKQELVDLDKKIRSSHKLIQTTKAIIKNAPSKTKELSLKKQKQLQNLTPLKVSIKKHQADLVRWDLEKINTNRHVSEQEIKNMVTQQELDEYDLKELLSQASKSPEENELIKDLRINIKSRGIEIKRLKEKHKNLEDNYKSRLTKAL